MISICVLKRSCKALIVNRIVLVIWTYLEWCLSFCCLDWLGLQVGHEEGKTFELEGWRFFSCFSLILQINKYRKKIAVTHRLARFCYANGLIGCGRSPSGLSWNKSGNLKRQLAGGKWMRKKVPVFHAEIKTKNMVLKINDVIESKIIYSWLYIHS